MKVKSKVLKKFTSVMFVPVLGFVLQEDFSQIDY